MSPTLAAIVSIVVLACGLAWFFGFIMSQRAADASERWRERVEAWLRRRRPAPLDTRPFEDIAADVRRCGMRYYSLHPHASFAKVRAVQQAYDRSLGECCQVFGVTHLLNVLEPGPELDAERDRVEDQLEDSGVELPRAA